MKRYLITGASRGIGHAIATRLAAPDITLLLHGRDTVALKETCDAVAEHGSEPVRLVHDLAGTRGVEDLIAQVGHTPIDLLVNNAGVVVVKPFIEVTQQEWSQIIGVNLTAPFFLTQHFAPRMPPGSSIVNILSIAARNAYPNWSVYCASKFALDGLSAAIREELRAHKIRVLNIYPAATDTEIWDPVAGDFPRAKMIAPSDVAEAVAYAISQPAGVAIENITLASLSGAL
jgi:NAD(P)-dependent dehydrogenase (short-subunit alcohol dehydrogenase family)